jgi:ABC-2 type transport system ATP-binding protein
VLATAYLDEAERCGKVHLLESGRLVADGEPQELLERERVESFDALFIKHARSKRERREAAK